MRVFAATVAALVAARRAGPALLTDGKQRSVYEPCGGVGRYVSANISGSELGCIDNDATAVDASTDFIRSISDVQVCLTKASIKTRTMLFDFDSPRRG